MAAILNPLESHGVPRRRGFEILLRKLLAYKRAPALIVLHWWSPRTKEFWQSAEDELEVFNKCAPVPPQRVMSALSPNVVAFNNLKPKLRMHSIRRNWC